MIKTERNKHISGSYVFSGYPEFETLGLIYLQEFRMFSAQFKEDLTSFRGWILEEFKELRTKCR